MTVSEKTKRLKLACNVCHETYDLDTMLFKCKCGGVLDLVGTEIFPKDELKNRPLNFWRYKEALALDVIQHPVQLGEIMTPLLPFQFEGINLTCKLDYLMPTGSYKDRGVSVCINHAKHYGLKSIAEDSSGNAGASVSAYAAAAGISANIYVPSVTSQIKKQQIKVFGSELHCIEGNRYDVELNAQMSTHHYIGHSWNPLFACGVKSIAYELAEQLDFKSPDIIITPVGGGSLVLGLIRGFNDLLQAGYIHSVPKIIGVQSESCCPIVDAWSIGRDYIIPFIGQPTVAEGIALTNPARGNQVLNLLKDNNGLVISVEEREIINAFMTAAHSGLFMEPTSAVSLAGAKSAMNKGLISKSDRIISIITGSGLKTKPEILNNIF